MLSGSSIEIEPNGPDVPHAVTAAAYDDDWKYLHRRLRSIAKRRVALEAEEASCLVEAEESCLYRRLGYTSMVEYMERELHWGPHAAKERLRVAYELIDLPQIAEGFRSGELSFSAVRELTRVATPETEEAFLEKARGQTARQVEHMVSGLRKGDQPDTPPDPALIKRRVTMELSAEEYALWRRTRADYEAELGAPMTDGELAMTLMRRAHGQADSLDGQPLRVPRPAVQSSVTTCKRCKQSFTGVGGQLLALDPKTAERMRCDAEDVGDLESDKPTRITPTIPQGIRRKVFIRDGFGCVVPGCRAMRHLDVHHIIAREHGGDHSMGNLCILCFGHHQRHHAGLLRITGRAPDHLVFAWPRDDGDDDLDLAEPQAPAGPTGDQRPQEGEQTMSTA